MSNPTKHESRSSVPEGLHMLDRRKFPTKAEARMAVFSFIEGWYNPGRRHLALGYKSPIEYERSAQAASQAVSP